MNTVNEWEAYYKLRNARIAYITPQRIGFYKTIGSAMNAYMQAARNKRHDTQLQFLDAGCGFGVFLHELQLLQPSNPDANQVSIQYCGCDWSERALAAAGKTADDDTVLMLSDLNKLPEMSSLCGMFHAITCLQVLENTPEPYTLVENLLKLLVPGCSLVITVPGPNNGTRDVGTHIWTVETLGELLQPLGMTRAVLEILKGAYLLAQIKRAKDGSDV